MVLTIIFEKYHDVIKRLYLQYYAHNSIQTTRENVTVTSSPTAEAAAADYYARYSYWNS
jgi:hypothetical protein